MNTKHWQAGIAVALAVFTGAQAVAEELATLKADRVNVRGEATLNGEVITQLRQGEKVTVLEEITVEKPKPGEPAKWARILLPSNTPVWIHTLFLDPETKTVKASRLNVRSGPGENFSVLCRLEQGATVKEIRTVGHWMEIEPPATASAYVAAEYLEKTAAPAKPADMVIAESKPAP
ncbi:MAG: SH3 domain-containing protein, partial [Pedosphaera parvula]|nr:SH3 domain-containing protein [Pedosphaera parvula]